MGMPLSGKTSAANLLAKKINYIHVDSDLEIERVYNRKVYDIIKSKGEQIFREYEQLCLQKFSNKKKYVVSAGGGSIHSKTVHILDSFKYRIWLDTSIEILIDRMESCNNEHRYLLYNTNNIKDKLNLIYKERVHFYQSCSNIYVLTDNKTLNQVVNESIEKINEIN